MYVTLLYSEASTTEFRIRQRVNARPPFLLHIMYWDAPYGPEEVLDRAHDRTNATYLAAVPVG